jgi:hypothetical protein
VIDNSPCVSTIGADLSTYWTFQLKRINKLPVLALLHIRTNA